jgi:CBS domain-containing protein
MNTNGVGCIPLTGDNGELVGILSERDILRLVERYTQIASTPAQSIMVQPVQTLPNFGSVARALYFMVVGGYRHLPVSGIKLLASSHGSNSLGLISIKNIARYLNKSFGGKITAAHDLSNCSDDLTQLFSAPLSSLSPQEAIKLPLSTSVLNATAQMNIKHTGSILVTDDKGKLKGIFTERDLITRVITAGRSLGSTSLESVMTPRPHTMMEGSSLALAMEVFSTGKYRHLPVVDEEENLLGVLSLKDFIRALTTEVLRELGA